MSPEILEALGAIVGILGVWLIVRESAWGWPVGLASLGAYVLVFAEGRLYGAMSLQVVYIALSLYGWYQWSHHTPTGPLHVSRVPRRVLALLLATGAGLALLLGAVLAHFTDAAVPWVDATLTATSLVAQALQTRKWIENWVVWMVANTGYVALYATLGMGPTAALYGAFLLLALLGHVQWRRSLDRRTSRASQRRVVVTGSECTGKTTLAAFLSSARGAPLSGEFSREYAEARGGVLEPEDVEPIARGQMALLDGIADDQAPVAFHDTDLVSTMVYARHYYGECPPWIVAEAQRRRADLYLLCHPDIPWQDDGVRDRPAARDELHAAFAEALFAIGAKVVSIRGDFRQRQERAAAAVDELLQGIPPDRR